MNLMQMKQIVTILKTFDGLTFELQMPITDYIAARDKRLALWKKTIFLKDFNYDLTISNVLSSIQKTKYLALPEPEKPKTLAQMWSTERQQLKKRNPEKYYEMERKEAETRAKNQKIIKEQMEKSFTRRAKSFMDRRQEDLKKLAAIEKTFNMKTTLEKLAEWEKWNREKEIEKIKKNNNS